MSLSPLESPLWAGLYGQPDVTRLLGDASLLEAMVRAEVALAQACADVGLIPAQAGPEIAKALEGVRVDPADLAQAAARDGVPVSGLVALLRKELGPDLGQWLHWGATSQDIIDVATVLQTVDALDVIEADIDRLLVRLGAMAEAGAEMVMGARTRTQVGLPSTFGALAATWGHGVRDARLRLTQACDGFAVLTLFGAAGTSAAFGDKASDLRMAMARRIGLSSSDICTHTQRGPVADLGHALVMVTTAIGRIGQDVALMAATGISEVRIAGGGSSTMPHKANPVRAEALQSTARFAAHLQAALIEATLHGTARDGVAWGLEWHAFRPLVQAAAASASSGAEMAQALEPNADRMRENLASLGFGPFSEGASFALAARMPRPEAVRIVKQALGGDDPRATLQEAHPDIEWDRVFDPLSATGDAVQQARAFARIISEDFA